MTDLLLKGGEVIDPSQDIRARLDVAVTDGVISAVAPNIDLSGAARVINVNGSIVVPGMIDLHTHVYEGVNQNGINPDLAGVRSGVTTVLDAGSAGCYTFGGFPRYVVPNAKTNIFCLLHISRVGLSYQPDTSRREDVDLEETVSVIRANKPLIQGVKIRAVGPGVPRMGVEMVRLAKQAATEGGVRLMVHIGDRSIAGGDGTEPTITRQLLPLLDKGDIITHLFSGNPGRIIDENGAVIREILEAQARGVFLDTAHGRQNFSFDVAKAALDQGVEPRSISTDMTPPGRHEYRPQHDRDAGALHGAGFLAGRRDSHDDREPGAGARHGGRARLSRGRTDRRHQRAEGGDGRLAVPRHRGQHPSRRQGARAGRHRQGRRAVLA